MRQNVASGASQDVASKRGVTYCARGIREPRGVAGRGVRTWRQAPRTYVASQDVASIRRGVRKPTGTCLQNVSSVGGRYVHPHAGDPPEDNFYEV